MDFPNLQGFHLFVNRPLDSQFPSLRNSNTLHPPRLSTCILPVSRSDLLVVPHEGDSKKILYPLRGSGTGNSTRNSLFTRRTAGPSASLNFNAAADASRSFSAGRVSLRSSRSSEKLHPRSTTSDGNFLMNAKVCSSSYQSRL